MVVKGRPIDFQLRYSVEQYHELIRNGSLTEADSVELLEGLLVEKMARNTPHDVTSDLLTELMWKRLPEGLRFRSQCAITLEHSEPEPDGAIVPGPAQRYLRHHPHANEVFLVIEIAESSLDQDRGVKQRIYARAGIEVYWIINLIEQQIEVYTLPQTDRSEPSYAQRQDFRIGDSIPLMIQGISTGEITVESIFPR